MNEQTNFGPYEYRFGDGDERAHRGMYYIDFMAVLNKELQPRSYFEIGTDTGSSLNCFSCDALCVDPDFRVEANVWQKRRRTLLHQSTSDDFFLGNALREFFPAGPDIAFLDGMHRAEFLLRDFMNTEIASHKRTLILLHDCLPLNTRMAERIPRQGDESEGELRDAWTGDVWRVLFALKVYRPDLRIRFLDCPPTGLIAICKIDPGSRIFDENYDAAVEMMMTLKLDDARLRELWGLHPFIQTEPLAASSDVSALLNCR